MPRPRTHDLDKVLDAAEALAVESGADAVTVRALAERTSVSNGAIYHAFGSRAGLVGRVWLRAARQFLAVQRAAVRGAIGAHDPADAVVVAADAPAAFLLEFPVRGRLLLTVGRRELLRSDDLPAELAAELRDLDAAVTELLVTLSEAMWGRADRTAVAVIRDCVVELPTALLLRGRRAPEPDSRERLAAAVRAILRLTPPDPSPAPEHTIRTADRKDPP